MFPWRKKRQGAFEYISNAGRRWCRTLVAQSYRTIVILKNGLGAPAPSLFFFNMFSPQFSSQNYPKFGLKNGSRKRRTCEMPRKFQSPVQCLPEDLSLGSLGRFRSFRAGRLGRGRNAERDLHLVCQYS